MGIYIDKFGGTYLPAKGKAKFLLDHAGAKMCTLPITFQEGLVCVVDNGHFDAAAYASDERDMRRFLSDTSGRPVTWLIVPNAKKLAL